MVLNRATDVISLPDEKGKLYRFVVTCGIKGRAFEIKASDQRSKSEWMHAIKEVRMLLVQYDIRMYVLVFCNTVHFVYHVSTSINCSIRYCITIL